MISASATAYELHSREGDGIQVRLMWRFHDNYLFVAVVDHKLGEEFFVEVLDHTRALDVFNHPFAYAGANAVPSNTARRTARVSASLPN